MRASPPLLSLRDILSHKGRGNSSHQRGDHRRDLRLALKHRADPP